MFKNTKIAQNLSGSLIQPSLKSDIKFLKKSIYYFFKACKVDKNMTILNLTASSISEIDEYDSLILQIRNSVFQTVIFKIVIFVQK